MVIRKRQIIRRFTSHFCWSLDIIHIANIKVVKFRLLKTFLLLRYLYMTQEVKMIFLCKASALKVI